MPSSRSGAHPGDGRGDSTATHGELHINLPGRNLFPGWPSLEMTGGTSSTLSQGVRVAALPPGRASGAAAAPQLSCLPVFQTGKWLQSLALRGLNCWGVAGVRAAQELPGK